MESRRNIPCMLWFFLQASIASFIILPTNQRAMKNLIFCTWLVDWVVLACYDCYEAFGASAFEALIVFSCCLGPSCEWAICSRVVFLRISAVIKSIYDVIMRFSIKRFVKILVWKRHHWKFHDSQRKWSLAQNDERNLTMLSGLVILVTLVIK